MKKRIATIILMAAILALGMSAGYARGKRTPYSHADTHYVVCMGSATEIVSEPRFRSLAQQNMLCSAYEIDVDGLVEVDWNEDATHVWRR